MEDEDTGSLVSRSETARLLDVSQKTLDRWVRDGQIPAVTVGPRLVKFRRADIKQIVQHGLAAPAPTTAEVGR